MLITPTPDRSGEIMAWIVANTRHFRGDPNAPVKIVEFSDFQ
jgi:protein-disulfide isomerase